MSRLTPVSVACAAAAFALTLGDARAAGACDAPWPAYQDFVARFVQDGRVVDASTDVQQTTSEGQSYAMFFALVANDRPTFDRLFEWVRKNLSAGRFDSADVKLPAWRWGRRPDGSQGVLDANAAADADLWIAYDLFQAGHLWREPAYTRLAYALATQIAAQEVAELDGLGPMLLPGPQGFRSGGVVRLNPSYLPLPLLRALAAEMPQGPWAKIAANAYTMVKATAPLGYAPDWVAWQDGRFVVDPLKGDTGSYDAIRVYLWAGLSAPADPLAGPWLAALGGMRAHVDAAGGPSERVATTTGAVQGDAPVGFWGALLPYLRALGDTRAAGLAQARIAGPGPGPDAGTSQGAAHAVSHGVYYDRVLTLFGTGAADGFYQFDADGRLIPRWAASCAPVARE